MFASSSAIREEISLTCILIRFIQNVHIFLSIIKIINFKYSKHEHMEKQFEGFIICYQLCNIRPY